MAATAATAVTKGVAVEGVAVTKGVAGGGDGWSRGGRRQQQLWRAESASASAGGVGVEGRGGGVGGGVVAAVAVVAAAVAAVVGTVGIGIGIRGSKTPRDGGGAYQRGSRAECEVVAFGETDMRAGHAVGWWWM